MKRDAMAASRISLCETLAARRHVLEVSRAATGGGGAVKEHVMGGVPDRGGRLSHGRETDMPSFRARVEGRARPGERGRGGSRLKKRKGRA